MTIDIGRVKSSKAQICHKCRKTIPARVESIKITKRFRGARTLTDTFYTCMECVKEEKKQ